LIVAGIGVAVLLSRHAPSSKPGTGGRSSLAVRVGNGQLASSAGQAKRLLGVNAIGTEYECVNYNAISPVAFDAVQAAAMRTWHINAVRVPLNEDCWLGVNGIAASLSGAAYQGAIKRWVSALNHAGIVAILDLHWSAPRSIVANQQWPMADEDHSVTFWSQVARSFASDRGVMFDLFNEPFIGGQAPTASDWSCWLNGCDTTYDLSVAGTTTPVTYRTAGMQQLVDAVRASGADQAILLSGLGHANDPCAEWTDNRVGGACSRLPQMPTDPRKQLGLSFHVYNFNPCNTATCWSSVASAARAAKLPMVTTEFGEDDCTDRFINSYMSWADQHRLSYLAASWSVNQHTSCVAGLAGVGAELSLLQSWDGTPSSVSPEAASFKAHLIRELP
jgi:endoglucanase